MPDKITVTYTSLLQACYNQLKKVGLKDKHAELTSEAICIASLRGTDSHGVRLLPHYLDAIKAGRINVNAEFKFRQTGNSIGIFDADHGIAHAAVSLAMDHAIKLARKSGAGFVSVKNSNHCGAMAYYGLRAAKEDMIGLAFTNATAKLKTFNAREPFFGINPICITAPMEGEDPFCYDAAPTVMSNNEVKIYGEEGKRLPEGVAADKDGQMTTDSELSKMLFPLGGVLGGYKGFGMAMVVDIFCSLLTGMPNGRDVSTMYEKDGGRLSKKRKLGQFVGVINIGLFEELGVFKRRLTETAERVRGLKKESDEDVMIPGDPEKRYQAHHYEHGISISKRLYSKIFEI